MTLIEWNNSLSVNVAEIDKQHQQLVNMINELNDAMKSGKGKDVLNDILTKLIKYTQGHFATEEKYFDKFNYPDTEAHKEEHRALVQQVSDFKKQFDSGTVGLSVQIMEFLSNWLKKHIQGTDKKYSACFNANGLK
ncbi:MAG: bacteriohemerythrin [Verrucomicrobiota bacterium]